MGTAQSSQCAAQSLYAHVVPPSRAGACSPAAYEQLCRPPEIPDAPAGRALDPLAFFTGESRGEATLRKLFSDPVRIRVHSIGTRAANGTLTLRQRIWEGDKPPRDRVWNLRQSRSGQYVGTLSDAQGPVSGSLEHGTLHLRFKMKGGLNAEQWLTPGAEPGLLDNAMVVRRFGLRLAVLEETIRKMDTRLRIGKIPRSGRWTLAQPR